MQPEQFNRQRQVDFERITLFFGSHTVGLLGMTVAVLCLGAVIDHLVDRRTAVLWGGLVMLCYIPRTVLSVRFNRLLAAGAITPANVRPWERHALLASVLPFVAFTGAVFLPYAEPEFGILFCSVFGLMLISGGTMIYSTVIGILLLFLNLHVPALIARSLWEGGPLLMVLAVALLVLYILLTRLTLRMRDMVVENISMRLDNAHQSMTDPLTQLWNRRRLHGFLEDVRHADTEPRSPFGVLLLDLDHFKDYNDRHGHRAGDRLLQQVATIIRSCTRQEDLVVRYGGEEFVVIMPSTGLFAARKTADRIIDQVRTETAVTMSAGIDECRDMDLDAAIQRADEAMYSAKHDGRDRICVAGS